MGVVVVLVSEELNEGVPEIMMFSWVDCNRRYFIVTIAYLEE